MWSRLSLFALSLLPLTVRSVPTSSGLDRRGAGLATITQFDPDPEGRVQGVASNRAGYLYAPSLMGNASYHLGGNLGEQRIQEDLAKWFVDRNIVNASLNADLAEASAAITAVCRIYLITN
jgi:hypothetical protein